MVTVAQLWMIHTMEEATKIGTTRGIQLPKHLYIYMDDCFCSMQQHPTPRHLGLRSSTCFAQTDPATALNDALNSVHPRVKFTHEDEKKTVWLSLMSNSLVWTMAA
jgi:hypothetical protein